jgi:hypothetical protein
MHPTSFVKSAAICSGSVGIGLSVESGDEILVETAARMAMLYMPQVDDEGCTRGKPVDLRFLRRREWSAIAPEEVWPLMYWEIPPEKHTDVSHWVREQRLIPVDEE